MFRDSCQRIGHGGASALAPANTLASFDAALDVGIDMIEFDVRAHRGELVLAHTLLDVRLPRRVRLDQALGHFSSRRYDGVELNVDLKRTGCEPALVDALRDFGMLERTLISSQLPQILDRVRALEPRARLGISVAGPISRRTHHLKGWRVQVLAGLRRRRWDAVMAQHRLVDTGLLEEVILRSGRLYAWTVNERPAIERLRQMGVHGIATADPRLFA
ncbi:MAG TPA: glycerophosphodiester phosphodiesterase [Solirubrobacteraceae bacterium]|jgi:glycerophosphoryl diester phosphodiesterase